jgi:uncharacterized protein YhbP (UPF0306 family)
MRGAAVRILSDELHSKWAEAFFRVFDKRKLAFLYQDERDSRFNKFVDRDPA